LTPLFAEAIRFGVKSTDPSFVGGDTWGLDEQENVDRVAYSGKVPVNVYDAKPGDYIIASETDEGMITGEAVTTPSFDQYRLAVGRVNTILDDGRAQIAVIVH
jgi:hypothetical protein